MKKFIIAVLFCITVIPASQATAGEFKMAGIVFSFPDDWSITGQQDLDGEGYYLSCEKDGENSSGLVSVAWVNDTRELEATIGEYKQGLVNSFGEQGFEADFSEIVKTTYRDFGAVKITYTLSIFGTDHTGALYTFHACGKTVTVLTQGAVEDAKANANGFNTVWETFKCK